MTRAALPVAILTVVLGALGVQAGPSPSPTSIGRQDDPSPAADDDPAIERFLERKFREANDLYRSGQYYSAYRLADALLVIAPDSSIRDDLKRFRRRAESRHLATTVLTTTFEPDPSGGGFPAREIRGTLLVENVSESPVALGEIGKAGFLGQAVFEATEIFPDGSELSSRGSRVIRLASGFRLGPGEEKRVPIVLAIPEPPGRSVLQIVTLDGHIRPTILQLDDRNVGGKLPWVTSQIVLLPEKYEVIRDHPYRHLQLGLLKRDVPSFVVACRIWRRRLDDDPKLLAPWRERTIDLLLDSLGNPEDSSLHIPIMRELQGLTGNQRPPTVESWLEFAGERSPKPRT